MEDGSHSNDGINHENRILNDAVVETESGTRHQGHELASLRFDQSLVDALRVHDSIGARRLPSALLPQQIPPAALATSSSSALQLAQLSQLAQAPFQSSGDPGTTAPATADARDRYHHHQQQDPLHHPERASIISSLVAAEQARLTQEQQQRQQQQKRQQREELLQILALDAQRHHTTPSALALPSALASASALPSETLRHQHLLQHIADQALSDNTAASQRDNVQLQLALMTRGHQPSLSRHSQLAMHLRQQQRQQAQLDSLQRSMDLRSSAAHQQNASESSNLGALLSALNARDAGHAPVFTQGVAAPAPADLGSADILQHLGALLPSAERSAGQTLSSNALSRLGLSLPTAPSMVINKRIEGVAGAHLPGRMPSITPSADSELGRTKLPAFQARGRGLHGSPSTSALAATRSVFGESGASSLPMITDDSRTEDMSQGQQQQQQIGTSENFPLKLYRMLEEAESNNQLDIISFLPNNQTFMIHDPKKFETIVMPKYFTTTRLASFQRQLNLYGFRRIPDGPSKGAYHHKHFLRGRKDLCKNIKRQKTSGLGAAAAAATATSKQQSPNPSITDTPDGSQEGKGGILLKRSKSTASADGARPSPLPAAALPKSSPPSLSGLIPSSHFGRQSRAILGAAFTSTPASASASVSTSKSLLSVPTASIPTNSTKGVSKIVQNASSASISTSAVSSAMSSAGEASAPNPIPGALLTSDVADMTHSPSPLEQNQHHQLALNLQALQSIPAGSLSLQRGAALPTSFPTSSSIHDPILLALLDQRHQEQRQQAALQLIIRDMEEQNKKAVQDDGADSGVSGSFGRDGAGKIKKRDP